MYLKHCIVKGGGPDGGEVDVVKVVEVIIGGIWALVNKFVPTSFQTQNHMIYLLNMLVVR